MHFFNIYIPEYYPTHMQLVIEWQGVSKPHQKTVCVQNEEQLIIEILKIETDTIKSIVKRFTNQRQKALGVNHIDISELKLVHSLGDICLFVRKNKNYLLKLLPSENSKQAAWLKVLPNLLEFCEGYTPGDGRKNILNKHLTTN